MGQDQYNDFNTCIFGSLDYAYPVKFLCQRVKNINNKKVFWEPIGPLDLWSPEWTKMVLVNSLNIALFGTVAYYPSRKYIPQCAMTVQCG